MATPIKTIPVITLAFAGTLIAVAWPFVFAPEAKQPLPRLGSEESAKSIPVQTLLPRFTEAPVANHAPQHKSSTATNPAPTLPGAPTQQPIFLLHDIAHEPQPMVGSVAVESMPPLDIPANLQNVTTADPAPQLDEEDSLTAPTLQSASASYGVLAMTVNPVGPTEPLPKPIVLPSALKEIATESVPTPLSPVQEQAVARVQDSFVKDIGGEEQSATDPGYKERWLVAQPIADQRLRAQIGDEAYREYQKALAKSAVTTQRKVNP